MMDRRTFISTTILSGMAVATAIAGETSQLALNKDTTIMKNSGPFWPDGAY